MSAGGHTAIIELGRMLRSQFKARQYRWKHHFSCPGQNWDFGLFCFLNMWSFMKMSKKCQNKTFYVYFLTLCRLAQLSLAEESSKSLFLRTVSLCGLSLLYDIRGIIGKLSVCSTKLSTPNMDSSALSATNRESSQGPLIVKLKSDWLLKAVFSKCVFSPALSDESPLLYNLPTPNFTDLFLAIVWMFLQRDLLISHSWPDLHDIICIKVGRKPIF